MRLRPIETHLPPSQTQGTHADAKSPLKVSAMPDDPIFVLRSDIVTGLTLGAFGVEQYHQAEAEFARRHLEVVAAAAEAATDRVARMMLQVANTEIANKQFGYGGNTFKICAFCDDNLPFLLWLTMHERHPEKTLADAKRIIAGTPPGQQDKVQRGVLELVGYTWKVTSTEKKTPIPPPSTGDPSSQPSSSTDEPTTKSAA